MPALRVLGLLPLLLAADAARAADLATYFPQMNLERFIAERLDVVSIGLPLPRAVNKRPPLYFEDVGWKPTTIEAGQVTFARPDGDYVLKLVNSGDYDGDGIEDVLVCFTRKSKQGAVLDTTPYVVTRISKQGAVRAIAYPRADKPCG